MARAVARVLVVFAHRPGGQSQFGSAPRLRPVLDATLQALVDHVLCHPEGDHRVELAQRALVQGSDGQDAIAARCGFGAAETLRRSFHRVTGVSPGVRRDRFA